MISLSELKNSSLLISHREKATIESCIASDLVSKIELEIKNSPIKPHSIGVIFCKNNIDWLVVYLTAINLKASFLLLPNDYDETAYEKILHNFQPKWVWKFEYKYNEPHFLKFLSSENLIQNIEAPPETPQILLTTSGSTGGVKLVRLSYDALSKNALSIRKYLDLDPTDKALVNLPVSYSYGLSIVNSHLAAGASLHLDEISPLDKDFFDVCKKLAITNLNGVPETHSMLLRLGFDKKIWPALRFITQAGGNLGTKFKTRLREISLKSNFDFFVMYGQTEAGPRISYINLTKNSIDKIDSIGKPIPDGELSIMRETGELFYKGPNVMMGYATEITDLYKEDEYNGELKTGDLSRQDSSGNFYITGRLKRIGKISGKRVSLDEIEQILSFSLSKEIFCVDIKSGIAVASIGIEESIVRSEFVKIFPSLAVSQVKFYNMSQFFFLQNGKPNYIRFREFCENGNR